MPTPIQRIVGLANPGKKYAETRHNAGAWFVEDLAHSNHITLSAEPKFHSLHSQVTLHDQTCHLLIPTTFMNLSGQAVRACMSFYKIQPDAILVVHDEIDLPPGIIRLKFDGGDGGHNGLKDIISHLHTKQFNRLRIGVGHPGDSKDVVDYVLDKPSKVDRKLINQALDKAVDTLPLIMEGEMAKAMQQLHTM
jgi:PTH1 family peptidyl-tRNA hydrolase